MATRTTRSTRKRRSEGKIAKTQTLPRQWKLLQRLPTRGPGKDTDVLTQLLAHDGFEVTKRTVERDLLALKRVFPLKCIRTADRTEPYRWRWENDAVIELGGLSLAEALSLKLVEGTLHHLLPADLLHSLKPRFALAARVLAEVQPRNRAARWPNKVRAIPRTLESEPPRVDPDILASVQVALLADEQLEIVYQSLADEAPRSRVVHPRALLHKGQVTYLVATRDDNDDPRLYAIHRMTAAHTTGRRVRSVPFNLDDYVASEAHEAGSGQVITLDAHINSNLAKILRETPISKEQTLEADGDGFRLKAKVRHHQGLRRWILGHGHAIEVLGPTELRKDIASVARRTAAHYA
jgi:predicted DNA-binding transcriptional regulator YafY